MNTKKGNCSHPNSIIFIIPPRTERTLFRFFLSFFSTRRKEKLKRSRKVFFSSFLIFKRKKERSLKTIVNKGKKKEKPKEEEGGKPSRKEEGKYKNFKGESAPAKMTILAGTSIAPPQAVSHTPLRREAAAMDPAFPPAHRSPPPAAPVPPGSAPPSVH